MTRARPPGSMPRFASTILAAGAALCALALRAEEPASAPDAQKSSFLDTFRDSEDRQFDLSSYLLEHKAGFLLVPIIITEPAVGNGGGAGALFFREPAQSDASKERGDKLPPNLYGVAAFKTSNGSYGGGLGGSFHFDDDRWRYLGGAIKMSINLDFYTADPLGASHKLGYNLDGIALLQEGAWRIATDTYLSARWVYLDIDSRLDHESDDAFFTPKERAERSSGLGLGIEHDTRDNTLSPNEGNLAKAIATVYAPAIGSDNRFETYRANAFGYFPFAGRWTIGARIDWRAARGDVPFYQLPSIDLRGIAYGRFQNENVGMIEGELRWKAAARWTLLAFAGVGRDWGRRTAFSDATSETTRGVGFRYTLARKLGLDVGIDWARGPDDNAYYLQVGTAWR
jgi:outer membrane protein assembly factor BamA